MSDVKVLNADYQELNNISWQDALCLIYKGKAIAVEVTDRIVWNCDKSYSFIIPKVIRLIGMVKQIYKNTLRYSKRGVFARDKQTCQYCRKELVLNECTIDHIHPSSKGGKTTWENVTTSCTVCNNFKGDKNLWDTHMVLISTPRKPSIADSIRYKVMR